MEQPKHAALQRYVQDLRVKDIRHLFSVMRKNSDTLVPDSLFPRYGITVGEFCTAYVVNMAQRQSDTKSKKKKTEKRRRENFERMKSGA